MEQPIQGRIYVVQDNIDTDQIIPAQYLNLVPTIPEEYEKLGSYALCGLPESLYPSRFMDQGRMKTDYSIVIAGKNFGCGSSREHAPIAMGAAGVEAVVAESYARIFFRNCVATGELYPIESCQRLCHVLKTGQTAILDLQSNVLTVEGRKVSLKPLGEVKPVIDCGGIFNFARKNGLISVEVPKEHRVVTLAEAPETRELQAKPQWEQELLAAEGALRESRHQRQEAGNFYRQHASEANRLQLRMEKKDPGLGADAGNTYQQYVAEANRQRARIEKLDAKIKELEARRTSIRAAHPAK